MEDKNRPDVIIIFVIVTLLLIGLIMILSASSITSYNLFGDSFFFFKRQLISAVIGLGAMIFFMNIDYRIYKRFSKLILLLTIVILIAVLIPGIGQVAGGSRRWIGIGPLGVQPSELAKLGAVIYLSHYLSRKKDKLRSFMQGVAPPLIILVIIFGLIIMEPDLGTAATIAGTFFIMFFAAGMNLFHLSALGTIGFLSMLYFIFSAEYRRERLFAFINPWSDPLDSGYHIIQSLLALGSGGLFGVGLGNSRQKFLYLPEPGTDFIFSVLGEEFGFIGTLLVLTLYVLLGWRGLKVSLSVPDIFGSMLAIGITSMIILQAFINIGVVTSSIPVTGITLPFISYGGSSLVIMLSGVGVLLNISRHRVK